ncbi:hypothetical protein GPECTOR_10g1104 [Gonium pectorale]|uniref:N-acetyltransferase domain-containing protein n=1 Tax=Gonium pectorale TaxID=33097 RepID=A0A150GQK2_GONPE|nr:hypothetical protein GPECTOR_10g1104 [Gonium pectorale]|eukprot:KXZ52081.1 hypothetical protein GPECTOR_10g1104 [Gonium pectorale]
MIRRDVAEAWDECGELWHQMMLDTYDKHDEFMNIDFIGVAPELARGGGGAALLAALLADADAAGQAVFLAACGHQNRNWYARHGFASIRSYSCRVDGVPGHCDLEFMVRPAGHPQGHTS